ncbi:hypothetical protein Sango_2503200 [Sesamum angolense]|uniref:DUF4283 domain-containing protein n=1 Tax=Sesamum angolense TaxID=2727404 RepID=A0AAE1W3Z0_9LAMI|nr:hypothetical protein Sango_2503200 [Sesamum angolense]
MGYRVGGIFGKRLHNHGLVISSAKTNSLGYDLLQDSYQTPPEDRSTPPLPASRRNFHRSVSENETDHMDRNLTISQVVMRVSRSDLRRAVNDRSKSRKSPRNRPLFAVNFSLGFWRLFSVSSDETCCNRLPRLVEQFPSNNFNQRSFAGDGILHLQPGRFPTTDSSKPDSAKTASFHTNQPSEIASPHSANSIPTPHHSDFCKFFLANSKPPSIGATEEINGRTTIIFSDSETQSLVANFRLALIEKFSQGIPPYSQLHRLLANSGIKGAFTVSLINNKHALISLSNESDFTRLWLRRIWYLNGFPMRIFKWSPTFNPNHESSIVPIWVSFSELPAHLFQKDALFAIANHIGTPLQIADLTYNKSNLSKARVCVEIDLLKPTLEEIDIQNLWSDNRAKTSESSSFVDALPAECEIIGKHYEDNAIMHVDADDNSVTIAENEITIAENSISTAENFTAENENVKGDVVVNVEYVASGKGNENGLHVVDIEASISVGDDDVNAIHCVENAKVIEETETFEREEAVMGKQVQPENEIDENALNKGEKAVGIITMRPNHIIGDLWRGKKWISAENAVTLMQNLKRFGVVIKSIKEDVEENIKRNRLAVSSAIRYQKCVLLFDPISRLNLKPLDTGEQFQEKTEND